MINMTMGVSAAVTSFPSSACPFSGSDRDQRKYEQDGESGGPFSDNAAGARWSSVFR